MKKLLLSVALIFAAFVDVNAQEPYACSQVTQGSLANGGLFGGDGNQLLAIDIPVYDGTSFAINTIKLNLIGTSTYINVIIRQDNAGLPGAVLNTYNNVNVVNSVIVGNNFGYNFYQHTIDVSSLNISFNAPSGGGDLRYWMEVVSDALAWESIPSVSVGLSGAFNNTDTLGAWTIGTGDYVCELIGNCTGEMPIVYCNASAGNCTYESITNVTFAGINNTTVCEAGLNDYTDQVASVTQGETEQISITIESDSDDYIFVFIDWNQDGDFNDTGESYLVAGGVDVSQAYTLNISIPSDAVVGQTRMRVFLGWDEPGLTACSSISWGEVEDYTVNVLADMSTGDFFASNLSLYPNPANDFFNLSSTTSIIENVKVTDLNGRVVKSIAANGVSDVQVNISDLTTGIYFVTVNTDNGTGSTKLVKK